MAVGPANLHHPFRDLHLGWLVVHRLGQGIDPADLPGELLRDFQESASGGGCARGAVFAHHRHAGVSSLGDRRIQRHLSQKRYAQLFGRFFSAAAPEDVGRFAAVRADEGAHVLHNPQDGYLNLLEHSQAPQGHAHRHLLWSRDNDRTHQRGRLGECELHVPRSRRKIDQEVVQLAPRLLDPCRG